jgi:hypothetical protein
MHYTHQQYRFAKIDRDRGDGYSMGIKEQKRTSCERSGEYDEILAINDWDRERERERARERAREQERARERAREREKEREQERAREREGSR